MLISPQVNVLFFYQELLRVVLASGVPNAAAAVDAAFALGVPNAAGLRQPVPVPRPELFYKQISR